MNLQSLSNWLPFIAFLITVAAVITFSKHESKNTKVKRAIAVILGFAILVVSIIRNNKELKDKNAAAAQKRITDSTFQVTVANLDVTTSLLNRKIDTIGSLNVYVNKLDAMGIKRNPLTNTPTITKVITAKQINENNGLNMGILGGSGNKVENNIYPELRLSAEEGEKIIAFIKKVQKDSGIVNNCIVIESDIGAKNGKFALDLMEYLKKNVYTVEYSPAALMPFNGLKFILKDGCITIQIGNL